MGNRLVFSVLCRLPRVCRGAKRRWRPSFGSLFLGAALSVLAALPTPAADKVFFKYGPILRSLEIDSIEAFATDGTVAEDLAFYFRIANIDEAEQVAFREALQTSAPIDPLLLDRFLYTDFGEEILTGIGNMVQTRGGLNGMSSLRAALILAAMEPDGLTLLNLFRQLPTDLQIDLNTAQELQQTIERIVDGTKTSIADIKELSAEEIAREPVVEYDQLPDLRQPGSYGVEQYRIELNDTNRNRQFYVDIYQPRRWPAGKTPVVIFSHGLGDAPAAAQEEAAHLASYGFVVAAPQHPGSDSVQKDAFIAGTSKELYQINDFLDRPRDVSFLLDELERRNATDFEGRLNLTQVGIGGHSFGGYTALALAGATIDFDYLATACNRRFRYLNVSLLLQCDALKLPREAYNFRDPRITAVIIKNPVNSSVFGPQGLAQVDIPVLVASGSHDPATPAVFEQFQTFPWFTVQPRYLVLMEGQAHIDISDLDVGLAQMLNSIEGLTLAPSEQLTEYAKALSVAFYETFVARKPDYQLYMRSAYADYLSQNQDFKIYMISEGSAEDLGRPIEADPLLPEAPSQPTDDNDE
jgi:predicted dienelactone hydrolase